MEKNNIILYYANLKNLVIIFYIKIFNFKIYLI